MSEVFGAQVVEQSLAAHLAEKAKIGCARADRLMVVDPILTEYCLPFYKELAGEYDLLVLHSSTRGAEGCALVGAAASNGIDNLPVMTVNLLPGGRVFYQAGLSFWLLRTRPKKVIISANYRNIGFWILLVVARFAGISVYPRGHGLFKKRKCSLALRLLTVTMLGLSKRYICYNNLVLESFRKFSFGLEKLRSCENVIVVDCPVRPEEKSGNELGVLFIGRLRAKSDTPNLLRAMAKARTRLGVPLQLHIIGEGPEYALVNKMACALGWVTMHGKVHDHRRIAEISSQCGVGCYPGSAGLSVVHYMALSLPPIIHSSTHEHGPECGYVQHGLNGLLFDLLDPIESLSDAVVTAFSNPSALRQMQQSAFRTYLSLVSPSMAERVKRVLEE